MVKYYTPKYICDFCKNQMNKIYLDGNFKNNRVTFCSLNCQKKFYNKNE